LNLLGVFLPGYEVSAVGAWIGLFWGAVLGASIAVLLYRFYIRQMVRQFHRLTPLACEVDQPTQATLMIDGHSFGLALGSISALGLFITTNWLVIQGTADESVHARLLENYLPGYSVSFPGSLVGGLIIFIMTYLFSQLLSWLYNRLASTAGEDMK
jgi:hypothetical protein